jgi:hypothetical protein
MTDEYWPECCLCNKPATYGRSRYNDKKFECQFSCDSHMDDFSTEEGYDKWVQLAKAMSGT